MPVAIDIVHAVHGRPIFINAERPRREAAHLTAISALPWANQIFDRVGRMAQGAVFGGDFARLDIGNLRPNSGFASLQC